MYVYVMMHESELEEAEALCHHRCPAVTLTHRVPSHPSVMKVCTLRQTQLALITTTSSRRFTGDPALIFQLSVVLLWKEMHFTDEQWTKSSTKGPHRFPEQSVLDYCDHACVHNHVSVNISNALRQRDLFFNEQVMVPHSVANQDGQCVIVDSVTADQLAPSISWLSTNSRQTSVIGISSNFEEARRVCREVKTFQYKVMSCADAMRVFMLKK